MSLSWVPFIQNKSFIIRNFQSIVCRNSLTKMTNCVYKILKDLNGEWKFLWGLVCARVCPCVCVCPPAIESLFLCWVFFLYLFLSFKGSVRETFRSFFFLSLLTFFFEGFWKIFESFSRVFKPVWNSLKEWESLKSVETWSLKEFKRVLREKWSGCPVPL